jgi:lipid II:glycine glycyltransferase (peptidoglycan interpeptide bridge formation enzyme)
MLPKGSPQINPGQWNTCIASLPGSHVLQTWEWGQVKSLFGWQPYHLYWLHDNEHFELIINKHLDEARQKHLVAAALVLHRKIMIGGFSHRMGVVYVPKGPLLDWNNSVISQHVLLDLKQFAEKHSAIFIKIDPDVEIGDGIPGKEDSHDTPLGIKVIEELRANGWRFSEEQVQFRNTVILDLHPSAEELLANMKQKTRYNVNLAMRKGVYVRVGNQDDLNILFRMYAETSVRDGFVIRNEAYYREVWNAFMRVHKQDSPHLPVAEALVAEVEGEPVAGAIIFRFAGKAWYLYGMSTLSHRDMMPNYLLQWEAIKRAKAANCVSYDLWGAPDEFVESDPLWNVYRFKEGLGGTVHRFLGAWDLPMNRMLYRLYSKTLPGLLDIMRNPSKINYRAGWTQDSGQARRPYRFGVGRQQNTQAGLSLCRSPSQWSSDGYHCRCHTIQPLPADCSSFSTAKYWLYSGSIR